jgi:hypothetical protein
MTPIDTDIQFLNSGDTQQHLKPVSAIMSAKSLSLGLAPQFIQGEEGYVIVIIDVVAEVH